MTGRIMRSTGSHYEVATSNGQIVVCRMRGKFRTEDIRETNPVAVGDFVEFEPEADERQGIITQLLPRQNHILRKSVKKTGHTHVLAANIDQALLIATLAKPRTSIGFIDRFLVTAESFGIPQLLVLNKADLFDAEDHAFAEELLQTYQPLGVQTWIISARAEIPDTLRGIMADKVTLVAGHSGVGKTTLLNQLTDQHRPVGEISDFSSKGKHTTTFAEMIQIRPGTYIIDTPGIKELGLVDMSPQELSDYFPEMRELRQGCKFGARCVHYREPGCAIIQAVATGSIRESRYKSYLSMLENEDNRG